jgi:hypothetical protein
MIPMTQMQIPRIDKLELDKMYYSLISDLTPEELYLGVTRAERYDLFLWWCTSLSQLIHLIPDQMDRFGRDNWVCVGRIEHSVDDHEYVVASTNEDDCFPYYFDHLENALAYAERIANLEPGG